MTPARRRVRPAPPGPSSALPRSGPEPRSATARLLCRAITVYQAARAGRPTGCRYLPTCSAYAEEAITRFGPVRGSWMALCRLARCHPWGGHGIDPVPLDRSAQCTR